MAKQVAADGPGCVVQVASGENVLFARGYGLASLAYDVPISPATVFPIASNSKEFGALAILLLAEEGKLSLDDEVRKFVPELPDYGSPLRIRHLIFHTSGVRDYQALRFLAGVPPDSLDRRQTLDLLTRQKSLTFVPGSQFEYSNAGYVLLGTIVERVSGKPLPDFAAERIFAPLGMTHTLWTERGDLVVPHGATFYSATPRGYRVTSTASLAASGGIWTTAGDFLHWIGNLQHSRLGHDAPALGRMQLAAGALDDGKPIEYGFGIFHDEHHGRSMLWHGGATSAEWELFPQEGLSVLCFCNVLVDSRAIVRKVGDLLLDPPAAGAPAKTAGASPPVPHGFVDLPTAALARLAGDYRNPASGTVHHYTVDGGKLAVQAGPVSIQLRPSSPDEVASVAPDIGWRLRFEPAGAAQPQVVRLFENGAETAHYDRIPPSPPAGALQAYAGTYWSDELRARYQIAVEDGGLVLHTPVQPNGPLLYLGADRFVLSSPWFTVGFEFRKSPDGRSASLSVSTDETGTLPFQRLADCPAVAAPR